MVLRRRDIVGCTASITALLATVAVIAFEAGRSTGGPCHARVATVAILVVVGGAASGLLLAEAYLLARIAAAVLTDDARLDTARTEGR